MVHAGARQTYHSVTAMESLASIACGGWEGKVQLEKDGGMQEYCFAASLGVVGTDVTKPRQEYLKDTSYAPHRFLTASCSFLANQNQLFHGYIHLVGIEL